MKKKLEGIVVRKKMQKTITVEVERIVRHPKYHKALKKRRLYHVHDPYEIAKLNDKVRIIEGRPYSKLKRWRLLEVIK
jgi:small subunit ribosomal protein S17